MNWLLSNVDNPYPTYRVLQQLAKEAGLSEEQTRVWFRNKRRAQWFKNIKNMTTLLNDNSLI